MVATIAFEYISQLSDDLDELGDLMPNWQDRFGDDSLAQGAIVRWSSHRTESWENVLAAYVAHQCDYLRASDFEQVFKPNPQRLLLRQLYLYDGVGSAHHLQKVAEPSIAKGFASELMALVGDGGAMFANTNPAKPFDDVPEYDLSTAGHCHFARCACAIFLTPVYVGRVEVVFGDIVET